MLAAAGLALAGRFRGPFSRKLKNAGVTDGCLPRFRNRPCADLAERRPQLVDIEVDQIIRPLVAKRSNRPEERLASKSGVRSKRQSPHHVLAAADAAVEKNGRLLADRRGDGRENVDRCRKGLDLPAAVVRNPDTVDAESDRDFGILGMQHAFHGHWAFPRVAISLDLFP